MSAQPERTESTGEYLRARAYAAADWRARTEYVDNLKRMSAPEAERILAEALAAAVAEREGS